MTHTRISIICALAIASSAGCALEEDPQPFDPVAPGAPAQIADVPPSYDPDLWVEFVVPDDLICGASLSSVIDIDPQEDGVQIALNAGGSSDYTFRWIRLVAQDRDTWYDTVQGMTTVTLSPGTNQLTAVGSSHYEAGQSNYCFITLLP